VTAVVSVRALLQETARVGSKQLTSIRSHLKVKWHVKIQTYRAEQTVSNREPLIRFSVPLSIKLLYYMFVYLIPYVCAVKRASSNRNQITV
jgi:hypothetical protein